MALARKAKQGSFSNSRSDTFFKAQGKETIAMLLSTINSLSDGDEAEEDGAEDVPSPTASLMLVAAKSLAKLCTEPMFEQSIVSTPLGDQSKKTAYEPYLLQALVAQHDDPHVHSRFTEYVKRLLQEGRLPLHYLNILVLSTGDDKGKRETMRSFITRLVQQRRIRCQQQQSRVDVTQAMPEMVLPHLLYLLSKHPDLTDDASDSQQEVAHMNDYFRSFPRFFLECCFEKAQKNNYTLVLEILDRIRKVQDNDKLKKMLDLTQIVVRELYQGKTFSASKLPENLFAPRASKAEPRSPAADAGALSPRSARKRKATSASEENIAGKKKVTKGRKR
jgi:hypothetical protein